jgi:hypothetical protein
MDLKYQMFVRKKKSRTLGKKTKARLGVKHLQKICRLAYGFDFYMYVTSKRDKGVS